VPCLEKARAFEGLRRMDAPKGTEAGVEGVNTMFTTGTPNPPWGKSSALLTSLILMKK